VSEDQKVLAAFLDGERIKHIPRRPARRAVVMRWLAGQFEPGRSYAEREVNEIIKRHHEDSAYLRREMVDTGLMTRDAGIYQLVSPGEDAPAVRDLDSRV
jgi:hypothetical protein